MNKTCYLIVGDIIANAEDIKGAKVNIGDINCQYLGCSVVIVNIIKQS